MVSAKPLDTSLTERAETISRLSPLWAAQKVKYQGAVDTLAISLHKTQGGFHD